MSTVASIPTRVEPVSLAHAQDRHDFFTKVPETAPVVQDLRGEFLVTDGGRCATSPGTRRLSRFEHSDVMDPMKADPARIGPALRGQSALSRRYPRRRGSASRTLTWAAWRSRQEPANVALRGRLRGRESRPAPLDRPDEFDIDRKESRAHFTIVGDVHTCLVRR
jgi:hypothetical protein